VDDFCGAKAHRKVFDRDNCIHLFSIAEVISGQKRAIKR
jgi:hypothetical protein